MRYVLTVGLVGVLALVTGAHASVVLAPVDFSGPGNSLSASGALLGSATVSGSGGMYTYDTVGKVWVGTTFTVPEQTVGIQSNPALLSLGSSPTGSMTVAIDDGTFAIDSFFDVSFDLAPGGMPFDVAPVSLSVNLDAGGTSTINLDGSGAFTLGLTGDAASTVATLGANVDVSATYGLIPLGYLFNAAAVDSFFDVFTVTSMTTDPGVGAWYEFGVDLTADMDTMSINIADSGSLAINTFSGSQYPYYALTLDYDLTGCASLCDVEMSMSGVGQIPEPTTIALLLLPAAILRLRRR